jgi:hypothetical protein
MNIEKKRLRKMINNEMSNLFVFNDQKIIRFSLKEEILLCEDVISSIM